MRPARLLSLDVFRGATIASMILVNNPGSWNDVFPPLEHAGWNGWTFTDLVFPFFLWIVGVSTTLSFAGRTERGENRRALLVHAARRAAIIFAIGLFLNGFPYFRLSTIRIPGVLQRIAVCYLVAAAIFLYTGLRGQLVAIAALLAVYWMTMTLVPVPGYGPGVLQPVGNFAQWVDSHLLVGHMWKTTRVWDPEGLFSTLPAVATALFGIQAGRLLRSRLEPAAKTAWMLAWGNAMILAGLLIDPFLPINKSLWTSSFAVFMAGMALVVFGICYWLVDVHGWRRGTLPLVVFGMNSIAMFVFSGLLARILGLWHWQQPVFTTCFAPLAPPRVASLLYAVCFVLVSYGVAYGLYRKQWFLKF
jgi:predicted acyltransferase